MHAHLNGLVPHSTRAAHPPAPETPAPPPPLALPASLFHGNGAGPRHYRVVERAPATSPRRILPSRRPRPPESDEEIKSHHPSQRRIVDRVSDERSPSPQAASPSPASDPQGAREAIAVNGLRQLQSGQADTGRGHADPAHAPAAIPGAAAPAFSTDPLLDSFSLPLPSSAAYPPALLERRRVLIARYEAMAPEARRQVLALARRPFLALFGPEPGHSMGIDLRREQFVALHTAASPQERLHALVDLSHYRACLWTMNTQADPESRRSTIMLDLELRALQTCLQIAPPTVPLDTMNQMIVRRITSLQRQTLFLHLVDLQRMLRDVLPQPASPAEGKAPGSPQ